MQVGGDTVAILYTSGTTGASKGVCCPQAQYFWWGVHTASLLEMREGEILYSCLPLFHTNALNSFYQALLTGSTLVVGQRFSVSGYVEALRHHGATITYLLGAMVPMLLSRNPNDDERAHKARIALAPGVPAQFHEVFKKRFGIGLIDGYGSTETNFAIGDKLVDQQPGFMGRTGPGFQQRLSTNSTMRWQMVCPASSCCAHRSRLHLLPGISECLIKPWKPGAIFGSTRATGLFVTVAEVFVSGQNEGCHPTSW
ncbi:AMP-binding protein [Ochrobactrum cytisi]|nr:AMP-binding protein [Brucella cytisi]